jgi:hypothetical protein
MGTELTTTGEATRKTQIAGILSKAQSFGQEILDLQGLLEKHAVAAAQSWEEIEPMLDMNIQLGKQVSDVLHQLDISVTKQVDHAELLKTKIRNMLNDNTDRVIQITGRDI